MKFNQLESYKERNLYYKFFAGYFFNELISGYDERKRDFIRMLNNKLSEKNMSYFPTHDDDYAIESLMQISNQNFHVTFDYYNSQEDKTAEDRGESADMLIWTENIILCFEIKYQSDWKFQKDIIHNQNRIKSLVKLSKKKVIHVLLITEGKWLNVQKKIKVKGSSYSELLKNLHSLSLIVLTWQELVGLTEDARVKDFLQHELDRILNSDQ